MGPSSLPGLEPISLVLRRARLQSPCLLDVNSYADDVPVPAFGQRMVCTVCGDIGARAVELAEASIERNFSRQSYIGRI
jgi:hypothetical protein